jgi:hypothetical protein
MTSSAVSAQLTVVKIATGSGSAKTITGVAVGNPTILTIAAHGFVNGDVESISGLTGADAALLNGLNFTVKNKTTNTIAVDVDTTGKVVTAGAGTATPITFTQVKNLKTIAGLDGTAADIDVSNLDSTAKENRPGLPDSGQWTMQVDDDPTDPGQIAVRAAAQSTPPLVKQWQVTYPNGKVLTFTAWVKKYSVSAAVDQVIKGDIALRITGPYTLV